MPQPVCRPRPSMLRCTQCGVTQEAACDCGVSYVPAVVYAAKAIARNPTKSNRTIAAEIGVDHKTVAKARSKAGAENSAPEKRPGGENSPPEKRLGRDGKMYPTQRTRKPRLRVVINDDEPTDEQCDADEQEVIYDQACLYLKEMTGETRQKFFAYIKRKYSNELR